MKTQINKFDSQSVHIDIVDDKGKKNTIRVHTGMGLKDVLGIILDQKGKVKAGKKTDCQFVAPEKVNDRLVAFLTKAKDKPDLEEHIRNYFHEQSIAFGVPFEENATELTS